jgi:hypothetical protein
MAELDGEAALDAKVRQIMAGLGVSRDVARLDMTIQAGNAFINDRVSLKADEPLDPELEADLAKWQRSRLSGRTP